MLYQENRIVEIGAGRQIFLSPYLLTQPSPNLRLQRLIDSGTIYVARNLSSSQFATLQAIAAIILRPKSKNFAARLESELASSARDDADKPIPPLALDYQLGLDELDTISRTRTGFPFAELSAEIQDAILGLIATRDLTTRKLDLARWLEDLHDYAAVL
jgi:hypothetical protein